MFADDGHICSLRIIAEFIRTIGLLNDVLDAIYYWSCVNYLKLEALNSSNVILIFNRGISTDNLLRLSLNKNVMLLMK